MLSTIDSWWPHLDTRGKSIFQFMGMLHNYWKTLPSTKISESIYPLKNTAMRLHGYPIYLVKNDPVNIVISTSHHLLTCGNRTTAHRFWFRQSATKWVEWRGQGRDEYNVSTILLPIVGYKPMFKVIFFVPSTRFYLVSVRNSLLHLRHN